jgi:hypothetical protein
MILLRHSDSAWRAENNASLRAMDADSWMERFIALVHRHVEEKASGKITEAEANRELEEMTLHAQLEMTDEEFEEFFSQVIELDYAVAVQMSADGRPIPGNDPQKPN